MRGQTVTVDSTPVVTGPSVEELAALEAIQVAKRNLAFRKAPKMRKRTMLARDVLALLNTKKLLATVGVYADMYGADQCKVCALGGLVEACFLRNKEKLHDDNIGQSEILKKLAPFFDESTLARVEAAFERSVQPIDIEVRNRLGDALFNVPSWSGPYVWGKANAEGRLRLIMANIINNHGEFRTDIPPTDKDYAVGGVAK